jgi:23S rRNA (cytosine1962-C5)-methyltransferase
VLRGTRGTTAIIEHGISYDVDPLEGQKTGFYLDQRENRATIRRFADGATVLDCFCNEGGFGLNAAAAGAERVLGIDISGEAITRAKTNAEKNSFHHVRFEQADVFDHLKTLKEKNEQRFDIIVLDPPSFTRSKKHVPTAKRGYKELHQHAFKLLKRGGILMTASCSHHIRREVFLEIIQEAAVKVGRSLQQLDWRSAAPDHPILPAVPETQYLKFGILRVH